MPLEILVSVLGLILILGFLVCAIVLPLIAIHRTNRINARLDSLEKRFGKEREKAQEAEDGVAQGGVAEPSILQAPSRHAQKALTATWQQVSKLDVEFLVGRHGLGWLAVVFILCAAGFFLKIAFDQGWVGQLGRVGIGLLAGLGLCYGGMYCHLKKRWLFSRMTTSAGVSILFLSFYSAFGYFDLIDRTWAGIFLVLLVVETAALAVVYDARSIAIMAVVGGLMTPILLSGPRDAYLNLFLYLFVLNVGVIALASVRPWAVLPTLGLVGTQMLFWLWYGEHYHPDKFEAALVFEVSILLVYVGQAALAHGMLRRTASLEDVGRLIGNAVLFSAAGYVLMEQNYEIWLGGGSVVIALVYAMLGWWLLSRHAADTRLIGAAVAISLGFVAAAFPLQLDAVWVAVGWAVQGLVLWLLGLKMMSRPLGYFGLFFLGLAVFRVLVVDTPGAHSQPFVPILNGYALPSLFVAACILAVAWQGWRSGRGERKSVQAMGLVGVVLVWVILSVETFGYCHERIDALQQELARWGGVEVVNASGRAFAEVVAERSERLAWFAQLGLSIVWSVFAGVVLAAGFVKHIPQLRWLALGIFGVTVIKVVLWDTSWLSGVYRVVSFLVLAVILGVAAWIYQKLKPSDSVVESHA